MRPSSWIIGIPVSLLAAVAAPWAARADDPPTPAQVVSGRLTRVDAEPGYGTTTEIAQEEAGKKACAWFQAYLDYKFGDIGWRPEPDELVRLGVVRLDPARQWQADDPKLPRGYKVAAHVDLTDAALRKLQPEVDRKLREARDQVQFQRNGLAARALAALVALCLVVGGYLRLEDLTRGYYTALLRLGAGAVVLLTVAGLFLLL